MQRKSPIFIGAVIMVYLAKIIYGNRRQAPRKLLVRDKRVRLPTEEIADSQIIDGVENRSFDMPSEAALSLSKNSLIISKRQFWSSTLSNFSLLFVSIILAYYTSKLSDETSALESSSINQVRAYVDVVYINAKIDEMGKIHAILAVKNYGTSPAYNVSFDRQSMLTPLLNDHYSTYGHYNAECQVDPQQKVGQIGPGYTSYFDLDGVNLPIDRTGEDQDSKIEYFETTPADEIARLKADRTVYVVTGHICFNDVFNNKRFVRICRGFDIKNMSIEREALYSLCNDNDSN